MEIGINSRDRTYPSMIRTKTVKVTFRLSPGLLSPGLQNICFWNTTQHHLPLPE
jgi:hypothetical protein